MSVPLLWLSGPSGVGKSAVGWAVFRALADSGVRTAYLDTDQLGLCYPRPADDPGGVAVTAAGLRAACAAHVAAGAQRIVVSGVGAPAVLRAADLSTVLSTGLSTVEPVLLRLRAEPAELRERITRRGWATHLADAAVREAAELDRAGGPVVETTGRSVREVAEQVLVDWSPSTVDCSPAESTMELESTVAPPDGPVLWLCGAPAVGKSSVGFAAFSRLIGAGEPTAYLDLAQFGFLAPGDHQVKAGSVAALWWVFLEHGARRLILTGAAPERVADYRLPELTLCRLHAGAESLRQRVFARGVGSGPPIPGDELAGLSTAALEAKAAESAGVAVALERAGVGVRISTDGVPISELVDTALAAWLVC